ncbi:MAG: energy-coupled thiamine transporter ThiT [Vulcanimicrobiota bacterium]
MNSKQKAIAQGGLMVALALLLEYITLFIPKMPQGGKFISLGMIPLIIYSMAWGWKRGVLAGITFGLIYYQVDPFFVHPAQFVLDYPLAFASVGLAGLVKPDDKAWKVSLVIFIVCLVRFLAHFLSGIIFFQAFAKEVDNPWLYSMIYNGTFIIPTTIACILIVPPVAKRIRDGVRS